MLAKTVEIITIILVSHYTCEVPGWAGDVVEARGGGQVCETVADQLTAPVDVLTVNLAGSSLNIGAKCDTKWKLWPSSKYHPFGAQ